MALHPLALAAASLLLPLGLGWGAGMVRLFGEPESAVASFNRFVLYIGFPLLIVVGMVDRDFVIPHQPAFWLAIPGSALLCTGTLLLVARAVPSLRSSGGSMALTAVWGNVAYIGLPVAVAVLGAEITGLAALTVALHVLVSMLLGPTLLLAWGGGSGRDALSRAARSVLVQPLAWAPVVGLMLRVVPEAWLSPAVTLAKPLASTAGPLALFLIGLFLHTHRHTLRPDLEAVAHISGKLVVLPLATAAIVLPCLVLGALELDQARLLLLMSAMPTAISTFALALQFGQAQDRVAVTVVGSTLLSALWLPAVVWAISWIRIAGGN